MPVNSPCAPAAGWREMASMPVISSRQRAVSCSNNVLPVQVGAQVVGLKIDFYTPFEMEYAGPAPYLVAGASQINFQVVNYAGSIVVTKGAGTGAGVQSPGFQIYVSGQ